MYVIVSKHFLNGHIYAKFIFIFLQEFMNSNANIYFS